LSDKRPDIFESGVNLERVIELLTQGEIELLGRVLWSSNSTFIAMVRDGELETPAVYKPAQGEQPLWDFDAGTLCRREVATYELSRDLGWPDIPPVVLREGPYGIGSVQLFVDADPEEHYFTLRYRPEFDVAFRRVALFDYAVNNADRKSGHLLQSSDGERIWCIDHGLTFHEEYKLRTVIWEYAGEPVEPESLDALSTLCSRLDQPDGNLCRTLLEFISPDEIEALRHRVRQLVDSHVYPQPRPAWRNVPYPMV
jgi:uncharacterized repeat protein (TIGR03843 family)